MGKIASKHNLTHFGIFLAKKNFFLREENIFSSWWILFFLTKKEQNPSQNLLSKHKNILQSIFIPRPTILHL